ncbi:zinc finger protein 99-like isoform X3 [Aricia agestis]|uniref:zinc finger protein 99-like isoform X3 n=1 Tax=Aricia agestis TaxID=91739 RepID=UPI001C205A8E|nr:zinc finger protein 99-like isoform X3 [Aricia agestis]
MEAAINYGLCRCCASEGSFKDLEKTYDWLGTEEVYANMLKDCFDISLSKQDSFNNGGICEVCITQLRNASNFKKQVQQTEQQFLKKIEDNGYQTSIIKVEVARPDDDDHDLFDDGNLSDGFSSPEYDIPLTKIKVEKLNETKPKKRAAKPSTSKAKKLKKEAGEPSAKRAGRTINIVLKPPANKGVNRGAIAGDQSPLAKHRYNVLEILMNTNATPIRGHSDLGYLCSYCPSNFMNAGYLKTHSLEKHSEATKLEFIERFELRKYNMKVDVTGLECKLCTWNAENLDAMIEHLNNLHGRKLHTDIKNRILPVTFEGEKLSCFVCGNIYLKLKSYMQHMHTHYRNYICEVCNAGYMNITDLKRHAAAAHVTGAVKCGLCDKEFKTLNKRKYHEKLVHNRFCHKCGYCQEMFNCYRKKEKHLYEAHGVSPPMIKCQVCDQSFVGQRRLTTHVKKVHLMDKPHKCTECEKTFFTKAELQNHHVKHTGLRQFLCDYCLKTFPRKKSLREHVKIHKDDRRFKCEHCGLAFIQKCSWRSHMRSKHDEEV